MCTTSNCRAAKKRRSCPLPERQHGVEGLRAVAVERQRHAHAHELDAVGLDHALVHVRRARSVGQAAGQDRHLVTACSEVRGLPVNVLGDAPELRVVVVRENADAHVPGAAQSARSAS